MTEEARTSADMRHGVSTRPTSEPPSAGARENAPPPPPAAVPEPASGQEGAPSVEHEAWFASSPPVAEPPRQSSMPPAYKAEVVQARLKRRTVVLTAVCALGGVVFALAAVRGIQRHRSASAHSHAAAAAITVATTAPEPSAPASTALPTAAPPTAPPPAGASAAVAPHEQTRALRPATAGAAKQTPPSSAATGIAASPPRTSPNSKRAPSKGTFDPGAL
jgi:hypothetical protein